MFCLEVNTVHQTLNYNSARQRRRHDPENYLHNMEVWRDKALIQMNSYYCTRYTLSQLP